MNRTIRILVAGAMLVGNARGVQAVARPITVEQAAPPAISMEFSVTEREADGSKRVIASPRIRSRAGQDATVTVQTDAGGLDLQVTPTRLADGQIHLDVRCKSWRSISGKDGKTIRTTRQIANDVVVAEGRSVELKSPGEQPMSLELAVRSI